MIVVAFLILMFVNGVLILMIDFCNCDYCSDVLVSMIVTNVL